MPHVRQKQIWLILRVGRLEEAKRSPNDLQRLEDRAEYWWQCSTVLHCMLLFSYTLMSAKKAVSHTFNNAQFFPHLGTLLINTNHLCEAEPVLLDAVRLAPYDAVCLSMLRLRQKRLAEAMAAADLAAKLDPEDTGFVPHRDKIQSLYEIDVINKK